MHFSKSSRDSLSLQSTNRSFNCHLDYGDNVYDRAFNESLHKNLESIQYNAAIAITGATVSEKLFQE